LGLCGTKGAKSQTRNSGKAKLSAAGVMWVGHTVFSEFLNRKSSAQNSGFDYGKKSSAALPGKTLPPSRGGFM
jgi:hypothetical protein